MSLTEIHCRICEGGLFVNPHNTASTFASFNRYIIMNPSTTAMLVVVRGVENNHFYDANMDYSASMQ